ncbi:hypothetical protein [Psychrobacter cryohalolentis]|uniref:hypothetical protein n=1 Tax=Psychrobacter cryohalolentis TaxID=330922 RepID=UPI003F848182
MSTAASHIVTTLNYQGQRATMAVIVIGGYAHHVQSALAFYIALACMSAGIA